MREPRCLLVLGRGVGVGVGGGGEGRVQDGCERDEG